MEDEYFSGPGCYVSVTRDSSTVLKARVAFICRVKRSIALLIDHKVSEKRFLKTAVTTRRHMLLDFDIQQHRCDNRKCRKD